MRKLFRLTVAVTISVILPRSAHPCEMVRVAWNPQGHPVASTDYVLVGEILGYSEPTESPAWSYPSWGLRLKIRSVLYGPTHVPETIDLYPYGLSANCCPSQFTVSKLQKSFEVGRKLVVAATDRPRRCAGAAPGVPQNPPQRLFVDTWELQELSMLPGEVTSEALNGVKGTIERERAVLEAVLVWKADLALLDATTTYAERFNLARRMIHSPLLPKRTTCLGFAKSYLDESSEAVAFVDSCNAYHVEWPMERTEVIDRLTGP